ncbi:DUF423 domain-containing protein [Flavobacterium sp.]|uniref:DUF423 domain-containing protein n=1 Tax=Flavobacterium sp. TaxID=239 RepID=UPI0026308CC4|nr:DUF423 domain-containing protein [Flavobacterium sp.]
MDRKMISTAAFLGMTAIVLGAFGAHALKKVLNLEQLSTFETGVKYQMYHALFLLFVGLSSNIAEQTKKVIYYFVVTGVVFFSGSIYLLATDDLNSFNFKTIGFITPIGGLLLIIGWLWLFIDFCKKKR